VHYLVFVPKCSRAELEKTAQVAGLNPVLGGHDVMDGQKGPRGLIGCMVYHPTPESPWAHCDESKQTWVPSIAKDENGDPRYYVGFWNDKPPQENQLRRHYTQAGDLIQLGGQRWKIPTPSTVDAKAVYNDDGAMRWEVVRQFSWVCDEAQQLTAIYKDEGGMRMVIYAAEPSAQINWLLKLLQINYRMLPEVAVYLELWVGRDHILDTFLWTLGLVRGNKE